MAKSLPEAAEEVLRKRNRELQRQLATAKEQKSKADRDASRAELELDAVESAFTAFFFAVDRLAEEVTSKTMKGRVAREFARKALEEVGIRPPSTLGSSRQRKKRTKRKKKS